MDSCVGCSCDFGVLHIWRFQSVSHDYSCATRCGCWLCCLDRVPSFRGLGRFCLDRSPRLSSGNTENYALSKQALEKLHHW